MKIKELPPDSRPRERLIRQGVKALSDAELLAIILRSGNKRENVVEVANKLLKSYNLKSLSRLRVNTLKKNLGIGETKASQIIASFELGRRLSRFNDGKKIMVNNAKDIARLFLHELSSLKKEHFLGIYLDSRKRIIKEETIFIGTLNSSLVHPREIFKVALDEGAAAIILIHNHPSGDNKPSDDDIKVTKEIIEAGNIMGIEVVDHIIIAGNKYFSFREKETCTFN